MATPYDAPIPGAAGYATAALGAKTAYQNALTRINQKRSGTLRQYGYLGDVDQASGVVNNVRVDPYNQYGGLQTMLRNNALEQQNAEYTAEEHGLHGGLAHKLASQARYNLGGQTAQLGSDFAGALGGYQDEQNQAAYSRDSALYEAELQAARDALAAGMFNPGDFSDVNYDTPADNGNPSGSAPYTGSTVTSSDAVSRFLKSHGISTQPKAAVPYVNAPGANAAAAKRTTTAAAKVVQNAKKKGGK